MVIAIVVAAIFWTMRGAQVSIATPVKVQDVTETPISHPVEGGALAVPAISTALDQTLPLETLMQSELPSPKLPLKETYDALVQSANAGDHRAACRLGMEFSRCTGIPTRVARQKNAILIFSDRRGSIPFPNESAEQFKVRNERSIESKARAELELEKLRLLAADCVSFQENADLIAMQWMLSAAKAGNPTAQIVLTQDETPLPHMAIARPELLQEFVRLAPGILRNAAQSGDQFAARSLVSIYAPSTDSYPKPSWLTYVMKPDPVTARVYLRLAQLLEARSPSFLATLTPTLAARALNFQNELFASERMKFDAGLSQEQIQASEVLAKEMFDAALPKRNAWQENTLKQLARFVSEPEDSLFMRRCELTEPSEK